MSRLQWHLISAVAEIAGLLDHTTLQTWLRGETKPRMTGERNTKRREPGGSRTTTWRTQDDNLEDPGRERRGRDVQGEGATLTTRTGPWTTTARRASATRRRREQSGAEDEDGEPTRATTTNTSKGEGDNKPAIISRIRSRAATASQDYKPSSQDYKPTSQDYKPSNQDYKASSQDNKPSSQDYKASSQDYKPSSQDSGRQAFKPGLQADEPGLQETHLCCCRERTRVPTGFYTEKRLPATSLPARTQASSQDYKPTSQEYKPSSRYYKITSQDNKPSSQDYKPLSQDYKRHTSAVAERGHGYLPIFTLRNAFQIQAFQPGHKLPARTTSLPARTTSLPARTTRDTSLLLQREDTGAYRFVHRETPSSYKPSSQDYKPSSQDYKPSSQDYKPSSQDSGRQAFQPGLQAFQPGLQAIQPGL
jgi:hypothetical protein